MMNKEGFLKELQARIAVLEDAEQQDILAEYAQHIDLRVTGGLTEEAAIQDFGNLDQLAAEILEAYHVKPAFAQAEPTPRPSLPDPRPALRKGCAGAASWFRRIGSTVAQFFRRTGQSISGLFQRIKGGLRELFHRRKTKPAPAPAKEHQEAGMTEKTTRTALRSFRTALKKMWKALWRFCTALIRLTWNLALVLCAAPVVCLGLASILLLGLLAVLLVQGYPLAGAAICCVGGALFCTGLLGLGRGLVWRRNTASAAVPLSAPPAEQDPFFETAGGEGKTADGCGAPQTWEEEDQDE